MKRVTFDFLQACMTDEDGNVLTNLKDVWNRWHRYGELFKKSRLRSNNIHKQTVRVRVPPLLHEIETANKKLKFRKAPGKEGIPAELIKYSGPAAKTALHQHILQIWRNNESGRPKNSSPFVNQVQRKIVQTTEPCH